MLRRSFLKAGLLVTGNSMVPINFQTTEATHLLTLSFDDGFKQSFEKIAAIHEEANLPACLNVIASGHLPEFEAPDDFIKPGTLGDFELWNKLKKRGHELMPHSWKHAHLANLEINDAKDLIDKCLAYFKKHLKGFDAAKAVFNFPFNQSTPELEAYCLTRVRAVRTAAEGPVNPSPSAELRVLGCESAGPETIDAWVANSISQFLSSEGGWLILNVHGLDGEGWGPMSGDYLKQLLQNMSDISRLEILPAGLILERYGK